MNRYQKIIYLLKKYVSMNGRLWNIDTNIYNTLERMVKNIKHNNILDFSNINFKFSNSQFQIYIDSINITPSSRSSFWSIGATRQFWQELSFFQLTNSDFPNLGGEIKVCEDFNNFVFDFYKDEYISDKLTKSLINSFYSYNDSIVNLGFSIFFTYIWKSFGFEEISNSCNEAIYFSWKTSRNKACKTWTLSNFVEMNQVASQLYFESYKDFVDILLRNFNPDQIIDKIYNCVSTNVFSPHKFQYANIKKDILDETSYNFISQKSEPILYTINIGQRIYSYVKGYGKVVKIDGTTIFCSFFDTPDVLIKFSFEDIENKIIYIL